MSIRPIWIVGAGSYALTIGELAASVGFDVAGFLDDDERKFGTELDGYSVSGPIRAVLPELPRDVAVAVAIGDAQSRLEILELCHNLGLATPSMVSPRAIISPSATLAEAVYVHPGAQIWTHAQIGPGTIISPNATVAHHTTLGRGCLVSSGAAVGASIVLEDEVFVGIGATVSTGVRRLGRRALVGAGGVLIRDAAPAGVYVGSPAKWIKDRA